MLRDETGHVMCCVDCGEPAHFEDVIDVWMEDGEVVQLVEWICLGDKIRRRQELRANQSPMV